MYLKAGTGVLFRGVRYTVTAQRGGYIVAVRQGEAPTDSNYVSFRTSTWLKEMRALVESWEEVDA